MRKYASFFLCTVVCGAGIYFWFEHYTQPTMRTQIESPLYTVSPASLLQSGKTVLAWGPLPGAAFYPGTLAFASTAEAQEWLDESGKAEKGWHVYELSGDFNLDTHLVRGLSFTNKTLVIARELTTASK
jgi:hypothetical protein